MSFEKGMNELERLVKKLEFENSSLEDSIADYEKGMKVLDYCKRQLKQAEDKVNQILLDADQDPLPSQKPPRPQPLDDSPLDLEDLD